MAAVQMNIRIDERTKLEGDAVLSRFAMTPSAFVRKAYERLVRSGSPAWVDDAPVATADTGLDSQVCHEEEQRLPEAGFAVRRAIELGALPPNVGYPDHIDYDELKTQAYFERAAERGIL